jgi:hypothetical protein
MRTKDNVDMEFAVLEESCFLRVPHEYGDLEVWLVLVREKAPKDLAADVACVDRSQ